MSSRELPGHIAALLSRQQRDAGGRPADSAGITWEGRDLSGAGNPLHTFDGDDGRAEPRLEKARAALVAGDVDEAGFVDTLSGARLFVPVVTAAAEDTMSDHAQLAGAGQHDMVGDKQADISLISIRAQDGRQTMPLFSSVETLTAWHPEARPVAAEAERAALAALAEGAELAVLDPGTELAFVLRRPALEALAQGRQWTPSYQDPEVVAALEDLLDHCPGVAQLQVRPGDGVAVATASGRPVMGGGSGPELSIGVVPHSGADPVDERLALASVQAVLEESQILRERADSVQVRLQRLE